MDAMEQLKLDRIQNFKNVITGKGKVDHIPHFGNYWSWKYYDTGYKLSDTLFDYEKMTDSITQFIERYPMDICYETGWRNPVQVTMPLKPKTPYVIDDVNYSISINDQAYMDDGDYEALIANPRKYLWETFLPKKYSVLQNGAKSVDIRDVITRYLEFGGAMGNITNMLNQHGSAPLNDPGADVGLVATGYEFLFNFVRGMKNLSVDMRRRPDQVAAAIEALDETFIIPKVKKTSMQPAGTNPNYFVDLYAGLLGHVILSPKQFERFYWPGLKRVAKIMEEQDKLAFFFVEGSCKRFAEFFQEFPKDHSAILCELDDVYELKEALPNMVICGGPGTELLANGTPEENVAYAKKLIEDIGGPDHRFIFSATKMVSFPGDCKRENLSALCDYLNNLKF